MSKYLQTRLVTISVPDFRGLDDFADDAWKWLLFIARPRFTWLAIGVCIGTCAGFLLAKAVIV